MPPPAGVDVAALAATAAALCRPGRGILASDESTGTLGARLARAGVTNTEDNRRAYRELFYTAPAIEAGLSGAILFHEAVYQADASGTGFVDGLRAKGIIVGVKVDRGLVPLLPGGGGAPPPPPPPPPAGAAAATETTTSGLDGLADRCAAYYAAGVRFVKWRCLLVIDAAAGLPSAVAVADNAAGLARYAVTAQAAGLVPIIEPEITIDGGHSAEAAAAVTERVLSVVYATLATYGVALEGTLLKPQMVLPGVAHPDFASIPPAEVARLTLRALRRTVPPAVPGVMFLSGGQSEARATACLNAINLAARGGVPGGGPTAAAPWALSFSFGRALQSTVLRLWVAGDTAGAQRAAAALAAINGRATTGSVGADEAHPGGGGGGGCCTRATAASATARTLRGRRGPAARRARTDSYIATAPAGAGGASAAAVVVDVLAAPALPPTRGTAPVAAAAPCARGAWWR